MTLIDLSHTIEDGLVTYKGLPAPVVCDYLSREASKDHYAEGTSFQIGMIHLCSNTGTYIDAPFHRYEDGDDIAALPLNAVAELDTVKITIPTQIKAIDHTFFSNIPIRSKAVLIHTSWSAHWNTAPYYENHPYLTEDAALYLKSEEVKLVGIDSYNIDDTSQNARPVHSTLLGNNILIIEHMTNMKALPDDNFKLYAVPVKIKGMGTFPVRVFAKV